MFVLRHGGDKQGAALKHIRIDKGLELLLRNKRKGINVILGSENATIYGHMSASEVPKEWFGMVSEVEVIPLAFQKESLWRRHKT
jgi:hypothetical protein